MLRARFVPEYLWSLDVGVKGEWLDRRLYADVTAFYMKRTDMQVSTGMQLDPVGDPNSYLLLHRQCIRRSQPRAREQRALAR